MVRFVPPAVLVIATGVAFWLPLATVTAAEPPPVPVIRVLSPRLARTLSDAVPRSRTLRMLVRELERSDLIVHVTGRRPLESFRLRRPLAGTMRFVTTTPTRRFLRITVDESLPPALRAAVLAHELWHALEVAREPQVVDQATFAALYRHIGHETGDHSAWYDTKDAVTAGETVRREVTRGRANR
jgi:hypothetical protein